MNREMEQHLEWTSHPKTRTHYLRVFAHTRDIPAFRAFNGFAKELVKVQLTDGQMKLWVQNIERHGNAFQVRLEMANISESGVRQDALIQKFRGEVGKLAEKLNLSISDIQDGSL